MTLLPPSVTAIRLIMSVSGDERALALLIYVGLITVIGIDWNIGINSRFRMEKEVHPTHLNIVILHSYTRADPVAPPLLISKSSPVQVC